MRRILLFLFVTMFTLPAWAVDRPGHAEPKENLTILIDEKMMLPATRLARAYAKISHTPLTLVINDTEDAEREIEQGLEAHVLISANATLINRLLEQGLTDVSSRRPVARMALALVASKDLRADDLLAKHISFAAMLYATPDIPVFMEPAGSEAGSKSQALLKGYEFSPTLAARAQATQSHAALLAALRENPALGVMLVPDALREPDLVVLSVLPDALAAPITYEAVGLASETMEEARGFVQFLASPEAQALFAQDGFQPAP